MFKFSVKQEVTALSVLAITSIIVLMLIQINGNRKTGTLYELHAEVYRVEADEKELRGHEKDFLATNNLEYFKKFNETYKRLELDIGKLKHDLKETGLDKVADESDSMLIALNEYNDKFKQVVELKKKIGLDHKSGLYGSLRSSVHKAEESIYKIGDYKLARDMLMLRRREKDFMLRLDTKYIDKFDKDLQLFNKTLNESLMAAELKNQITLNMQEYEKDFKALVAANKEFGLTPSAGIMGKMRTVIKKSEEQIEILKEHITKKIEETIAARFLKRIMIGLVITALVIGAGVFIMRSITRPINKFSGLMSSAAENLDLTTMAEEDAPQEIAVMAKAFNKMITEFNDAIQKISRISAELDSASTTLDGVSASVSKIVNSQLMESEKVAAAMNQMTATTQNISLNASTAAAAAESADTQALQGRDVVVENQNEVSTLAQNVNDASIVIGELSKESENIGTVLSVIREIAEQTNLLALNAAIEAARAGEQGRGFAVVADEVRTLALRSQESTEEIKSIVERLQTTAEQAVRAMETGKDQAQTSVERSHVASDILGIITEAVESIKDMNFQIATASEQQSAVAEEINRNIVNISEITQTTNSSTNQVIQSGKTLADSAHKITELMQKFKV